MLPVKNSIDPLQTTSPAKLKPLKDWQARWERYLLLTGPRSTCDRYSRAVQKFVSRLPDRRFAYDFGRSDVQDYRDARLAEGASPNTVRLEIAALRNFFGWMLDLGVPDVMFNPASGVTVSVPRRPYRCPKCGWARTSALKSRQESGRVGLNP